MALSAAFTAASPLLPGATISSFSSSCTSRRRPRSSVFPLSLPQYRTLKQPVVRPVTVSQLNDGVNDSIGNDRPREGPARPQQRTRSLFIRDTQEEFWESTDVDTIFAPIRPEEEELLKAKLPLRLAQFFIDRANDANRFRQTPNGNGKQQQSALNTLFPDLPPDTPDWDDPINDEYKEYVYVTTTGPPAQSFRRRNLSVFGGGDGLPDPDESGLIGKPYVYDDGQQIIRPYNNPDSLQYETSQPRVNSLFVGQVDSVDEQASRLGYGIVAILAFSFLLKLVFAVISFFLSFTFSFFAIFALSAGIFVLFFLIRF